MCTLQDEARRLAEQVHALEDTRNRWNAEFAAREATVSSKEEALVADMRQKDADQRRRLAQDQQVRLTLPQPDHTSLCFCIMVTCTCWRLVFARNNCKINTCQALEYSLLNLHCIRLKQFVIQKNQRMLCEVIYWLVPLYCCPIMTH